jgi:serine/threonine-protein kinase RsbW
MTLPHDLSKSDHCNGSDVWCLENSIESDPDNCMRVIEMLLPQLEAYQWSNRDTFGIHMAMEEAIMNAIRHGNQSDPKKRVHIRINVSGPRFYSKITDEGTGFDLADVPDPTLEENLEKTSGRGVMLIKSFVDVVKYNEIGNSVELEKVKAE